MLNLFQIYGKFSTFFKNIFSLDKSQPKKDTEYLSSLFFGILNEDKEVVDIKCLLPEVTNSNEEEIQSIAENYAKLLVFINIEEFNKNIYSILLKHKNKNNPKQTMLIDNIISFWNILYDIEIKKQYKKNKSDQPMIRPSEAFKIK